MTWNNLPHYNQRWAKEKQKRYYTEIRWNIKTDRDRQKKESKIVCERDKERQCDKKKNREGQRKIY